MFTAWWRWVNGSSSSTTLPSRRNRRASASSASAGSTRRSSMSSRFRNGSSSGSKRARPPCRRGERGDCLRIRLGNALDAAHELEMLWPDVRDDCDVGPGDRAERRHLAEAPHPHLRHQDLGLRLEPAHGQRQSDLVVEALLRPQGCRVRSAERAQDVLRRGLPGGAHDRDHPRVALRAHEGGERRERRVLVVGYERCRSARQRLIDVLDPGVERDEELPGLTSRESALTAVTGESVRAPSSRPRPSAAISRSGIGITSAFRRRP